MKTKLINGLVEIYDKYDIFLIDLWGVIHNGVKPYPGAMEVLKNLKKKSKKFIFISNAPRPSKNVKDFLVQLKIDKIFLRNIFTSGEAALQALKKNTYGKKFFHLGPKRDEDLISGFEKNNVSINNCDFILCTGLFESQENDLNYYKKFLKNYIKIKMVCTNPDLIVHRGSKKEYCAGSIAEIFKSLGGEVIYFGKPYPEIYNFFVKKNKSILAIGDNIRTDIKGANNMKFDSLFIIQGIHNNEFNNISEEKYDKILEKYNVKTNYYQKKLSW